MIKEKLGGRLDGWIRAVFPFFFAFPVNPHLLTAVGGLVSLFAAGAFAHGSLRAGGLLVALGGVFDLVDGVVARHHGRSSSFGGFLDSTMDRFVDLVLMLGILLHYAGTGRPGDALLAAAALVVTVLTSYAKARGEFQGATLEVGVLERGERILLLIFGGLTGFLVPALWIVTVGGAITVVQRCALAYRQLERLDSASRADVGELS